MSDNSFDIKILDLHWIKSVDDPTDLCAHGHVFVKIGNHIIADENSMDVTVSSTALYLLRTLKYDYKKGDYASQLLPCCGHFFLANNSTDHVDIIGCPSGIDWTIVHTDDDRVKHISDNGQEVTVELQAYQKTVLDFADQVECFYQRSLPKEVTANDDGYLAFWKEWRSLREDW